MIAYKGSDVACNRCGTILEVVYARHPGVQDEVVKNSQNSCLLPGRTII